MRKRAQIYLSLATIASLSTFNSWANISKEEKPLKDECEIYAMPESMHWKGAVPAYRGGLLTRYPQKPVYITDGDVGGQMHQIYSTVGNLTRIPYVFETHPEETDASKFTLTITQSYRQPCKSSRIYVTSNGVSGCRVEGCRFEAHVQSGKLRKMRVWIPTVEDRSHSQLLMQQAVCISAAMMSIYGQWGAWLNIDDSDIRPQGGAYWIIEPMSHLGRCLIQKQKNKV